MTCKEYSKGVAGWDSCVGRWRDEDGRFTSAPCGSPCQCKEEEEYDECEEDDPDEEPLCGCYTGRPVSGCY